MFFLKYTWIKVFFFVLLTKNNLISFLKIPKLPFNNTAVPSTKFQELG